MATILKKPTKVENTPHSEGKWRESKQSSEHCSPTAREQRKVASFATAKTFAQQYLLANNISASVFHIIDVSDSHQKPGKKGLESESKSESQEICCKIEYT